MSVSLCESVCLLEPLYSSGSLTSLSFPSASSCPPPFFFYLPDSLLPTLLSSSRPPLILLIVLHSPSSSFASLSEYGPHRLPISLVCRRLQRLLRLADPPGRGPRAAPSSSADPERQPQRASTAATTAETQPRTGYPPLRPPHPPAAPPPFELFAWTPSPAILPVGKADMSVCLKRRLQRDMFLLPLTTNPAVIPPPVPNNAPGHCVVSLLFAQPLTH